MEPKLKKKTDQTHHNDPRIKEETMEEINEGIKNIETTDNIETLWSNIKHEVKENRKQNIF